jgi:hypothetical protein
MYCHLAVGIWHEGKRGKHEVEGMQYISCVRVPSPERQTPPSDHSIGGICGTGKAEVFGAAQRMPEAATTTAFERSHPIDDNHDLDKYHVTCIIGKGLCYAMWHVDNA